MILKFCQGKVSPENKIQAIKLVRSLGGLGLKETKDFVEGLSFKPADLQVEINNYSWESAGHLRIEVESMINSLINLGIRFDNKFDEIWNINDPTPTLGSALREALKCRVDEEPTSSSSIKQLLLKAIDHRDFREARILLNTLERLTKS